MSQQEEWVVCRIFQKSAAAKKPQQTESSQQSMDSPNCDTNTTINMHDFGDFDHLPNLNSVANSSTNHIPMQNYNNNNIIDQNNNINNLNMNMNWAAARETAASTIPSLSWPSNLLNSNLSMNSLLLRALQIKSYQQQREATSADYSFMPQGVLLSHFGTDHNNSNFSSNNILPAAATVAASSSAKALDSVEQEHQEQPFNLDSIW